MGNLKKLQEHPFIKNLFADARIITKGRTFKISDTHLPSNTEFLEWEYHIHTVGFFTMHLLHLCNQINSAIEFISNYNYKSSEAKEKRIEHLEYNIENYIIRVASIKDRTLQVFNAVFHLCMDEASVSESTILNNLKVHRTKLLKLFPKLTKTVKRASGDRNTIIHRHTYMNAEIRKLHILYSDFILGVSINNRPNEDTFKSFRTERLKKYLKEKKVEMKETNEAIFSVLFEIFTELDKEYCKVKKLLQEKDL